MKKALSYSVACRFEGMLRRVLHALAEEADERRNFCAAGNYSTMVWVPIQPELRITES